MVVDQEEETTTTTTSDINHTTPTPTPQDPNVEKVAWAGTMKVPQGPHLGPPPHHGPKSPRQYPLGPAQAGQEHPPAPQEVLPPAAPPREEGPAPVSWACYKQRRAAPCPWVGVVVVAVGEAEVVVPPRAARLAVLSVGVAVGGAEAKKPPLLTLPPRPP